MPNRRMVVVTAVCTVAVAVSVRAALRKRDGSSVDHAVSRREIRSAAGYWTEERMRDADPA